MTNTKNTKRALLSSVLALFLCFAMLLGTTYAWFTDSVTSGNNKIVAGTLDIALYKVEPDPMALLTGGNPVKVIGEITNSSDPLFGEDIRWEPGYAAVSNLMLENKGNLALKWQAVLRPVADIGELAEVIDVYVARELLYTENAKFENFEDNLTKVGTLRDVMNGKEFLSGTMEEKGDTEWFSIVLKMQETAGNEYQGKSAGAFDITILATQYTYESDSFDNQYDKDSVYGDVMVSTDAELKAAIENPNMKVIAVNGDLTYDWGGESYENSKALNMKGKTFLGANDAASITFAGYGSANPIVNATFKDIAIKDVTKGDNESSWEHGHLEFKNLTALNVTFENTIMLTGDNTLTNCVMNNTVPDWYGIWVGDGNTVIKDSSFSGTRSVKIHEAYGSNVESVVIDNCVFGALSEKPGVVIGDLDATTKVTIKNSTFANCQAGDQGMYIYESDTDVSKIKFVNENNKIVADVTSVTDLADTLANAKAGTVINLKENTSYGTVTVDELKDVVINGAEGTTVIFKTDANTKLEDVTLTNFDFEYTGATYDCGIVIDANAQIDNLVVDGCTVTGDGSKAGRGLSGANNNATIVLKNCTFKDLGYPVYAWGGYEALTIEGCTFDNIKSWAIMPQSGFDGDLTVTGCTFKNCLGGGLIKAGTLTAGHTFTFTDNTVTNCTIAGDHNWFQFNVSAGTTVISGNTMDGVSWTPGAADGLK